MAAVERIDQGAISRLILSAGKGNVLTSKVAAELEAALAALAARTELKAVVLSAAGANFSFGASVEEHLPAQAPAMLAGFHALIRALLEFPVPVLAAVQGRCLGGGLEVALACTRIFVAPDAQLGQPEIRLAVFAPAASALLPPRIGQPAADELLITGRTVDANEAIALGLADKLAQDPVAAATRWASEMLAGDSPAALRIAMRASRDAYVKSVEARLAAVEQLYLREVVPSPDALEGLTAFIDKRAPRFMNGK